MLSTLSTSQAAKRGAKRFCPQQGDVHRVTLGEFGQTPILSEVPSRKLSKVWTHERICLMSTIIGGYSVPHEGLQVRLRPKFRLFPIKASDNSSGITNTALRVD